MANVYSKHSEQDETGTTALGAVVRRPVGRAGRSLGVARLARRRRRGRRVAATERKLAEAGDDALRNVGEAMARVAARPGAKKATPLQSRRNGTTRLARSKGLAGLDEWRAARGAARIPAEEARQALEPAANCGEAVDADGATPTARHAKRRTQPGVTGPAGDAADGADQTETAGDGKHRRRKRLEVVVRHHGD